MRSRFSPVGRNALILSALAAVALLVLYYISRSVLQGAGFQIADDPSPRKLESWSQLPLGFIEMVIVAPFTEELLFRGLLLDWLRQKMNVWLAAVMLSVIFSLLHFNPFSLGALGWLDFNDRFLAGIAMSTLAIKYHSLRPSFIMHATTNALSLAAMTYSFAYYSAH